MVVQSYMPVADAPGWLDSADRGTRAWHVLHVKSRQEKILSDDLSGMGVWHYLPLIRQLRYYGKRKATVEVPLFPGYLFVLGTLDDAYAADRTRRVAGIIRVADQRQLDWELRNIQLALSQRAPLDPYPFLCKGIRVEVRSGPFCGLQGVIEDRFKTDRLILQVKMLGAATSLEIDGALVEPLE
jgi:transcription termination/antitermination protein NusG